MRRGPRVGAALWAAAALACGGEGRPAAQEDAATARHSGSPNAPEMGLARYALGGAPAWRATLPDELHEISGLAVTSDGRLFAHGDEAGTIYQVDPRAGKILARFSLSSEGVEADLGKKRTDSHLTGDFEDLAIVGQRFFLVTSNGVLLEFAEGKDGAEVPVTTHVTGLEDVCEIEGLAHARADETLLLLCKTMRDKSARAQVAVYAWSLADRKLGSSPRLSVPWSALAPLTGGKGFNGSALAVTPDGRSLAMVAGPQQLFAEVTPEGSPVTGGALDPAVHPQPEGLAFLPDGTLLVANEGDKGRASISGYRPR